MSTASIFPGLRLWFDEYYLSFADSPDFHGNMKSKHFHTMKVVEAAREICASESLQPEDAALAEIAALLHDLGRFEQLARYRTFDDSKSIDHATLGVAILRTENLLSPLRSVDAALVTAAIHNHNKAGMEAGLDDRAMLIGTILRDADKLDIYRVVLDHYEREIGDESIAWNLPDSSDISPAIAEAVTEGRAIGYAECRSKNDFKLLQLGWVFDFRFAHTARAALECGYLERIRRSLPDCGLVDRAYGAAMKRCSDFARASFG